MKNNDRGQLNRGVRAIALAASLHVAFASGAAAEQVLRSLMAFPSSDNTSTLFEEFAALVNERGAGVVRIDIIGGPEVVPGFQQTEAVARGTIDMTFAPISYSLGAFPEGDAWVGGNIPPVESRANGGFALVQQAAAEKLGVHVLSRFAPGAPINLFFINEPPRDGEGRLNLAGLRMRASPLYNAFYESLGAVPVTIAVPDIYTGLERGTFDGLGFPPSAIEGWSWERFLQYRLDPGFMQTDLGIYVNPARWAALDDAARGVLTDTAIEFEASSHERWLALTDDVNTRFEAQGMQVVTLEDAAAEEYLETALGSVWARLEASGSPHYADLRRTHFTD